MKPTNNNEEIFPCTKGGNHAQPSVTPTKRKKVILIECCHDETYYLNLTNEQIALLSWLTENIFDAEYEVVDTLEFETI